MMSISHHSISSEVYRPLCLDLSAFYLSVTLLKFSVDDQKREVPHLWRTARMPHPERLLSGLCFTHAESDCGLCRNVIPVGSEAIKPQF